MADHLVRSTLLDYALVTFVASSSGSQYAISENLACCQSSHKSGYTWACIPARRINLYPLLQVQLKEAFRYTYQALFYWPCEQASMEPYQPCCRLLADIRWPGAGDHHSICRATAYACLQHLQVSCGQLYCPPLDGNALHTALGASPGAYRVLLAADVKRDNKFTPWLNHLRPEGDTFHIKVGQTGASTQLSITLRLPALLIPSASPHLNEDQVCRPSRLCSSLNSVISTAAAAGRGAGGALHAAGVLCVPRQRRPQRG